MKYWTIVAALTLVLVTACNSKEKAVVGHDVEHAHVEEVEKVDHSHEEAHHEEHDHDAHHPDHAAE